MANENNSNQHLDDETGEVRQAVICLKSSERTCGRREVVRSSQNGSHNRVNQRRFRVPISFQTSNATKKEDDWPIYNQKELRMSSVQDTMVCRAQNISPMVYLLPTLLFFPAWASILCAVCEASIHIWAHKSNELKGKDEKEYRSPLSLISAEFCAQCRTQKWMQKIGEIQDKRSLRRNLINPRFMKHFVR